MEPEAGAQLGSDAELITRVRVGDTAAFGELYRRHVGAATALARQVARSPAEGDDLVSESFARVLDGMKSGGGPDAAFRAYLFTTLRHTAYDRTRKDSRLKFTDDMEAHETAVDGPDPVIAMAENGMVGKAFASLPERWQAVLWHTQVEGMSPAEVGVLLGMSANAVTSLAFRAREGLREAYLQAHLAETAPGAVPVDHRSARGLGPGRVVQARADGGRRAPGQLRSLRRAGRRAHRDQLQPAQHPRTVAPRRAGRRLSRGARAGRCIGPGRGAARPWFSHGCRLGGSDDGRRGRGGWCARGRRSELVQPTLGRRGDGRRGCRGCHGRGHRGDRGWFVADGVRGRRCRDHRGLDRSRRSWCGRHRRDRGFGRHWREWVRPERIRCERLRCQRLRCQRLGLGWLGRERVRCQRHRGERQRGFERQHTDRRRHRKPDRQHGSAGHDRPARHHRPTRRSTGRRRRSPHRRHSSAGPGRRADVRAQQHPAAGGADHVDERPGFDAAAHVDVIASADLGAHHTDLVAPPLPHAVPRHRPPGRRPGPPAPLPGRPRLRRRRRPPHRRRPPRRTSRSRSEPFQCWQAGRSRFRSTPTTAPERARPPVAPWW